MKASKHAQRLIKLVESFPRLTVTALADLVADEFVFGEIARVSREAPVLILRYRERTVVPGGGANAICNLADLGVNVLPVGWVGDDEPGRLLLETFRHRKVPASGILTLKKFNTVTKTRILAGMTHTARQQVVRLDREPDALPGDAQQARLMAAAQKYIHESDALLVSDYGYGSAAPEMLKQIEVENIPITLDSRYRMTQFAGVTAATPNEPEVEAALGVEIGDDAAALRSAGQSLLKKMKLESLVITRGRDGMAVFARGRRPLEIPIHGTDQVADVTGAGDTVIAAFTAALAAGADAEEAAHLANYAGGIVVMKRGTATVTRAELLAAIAADPRSHEHTL
jgi:D-glycero-beta-D-manno-heptose-7-phosphate kinase